MTYVAAYYGWAWNIRVEPALANAFRVSSVLVFSCILGALQLASGRGRWIEAIATVEGVLIVGTMGELWLGAREVAWLTITLISASLLYYWLLDTRRAVAAVAVLVAGIVPGALTIVAAADAVGSATLALLYLQVAYGVLALPAVLLAARVLTRRPRGTLVDRVGTES